MDVNYLINILQKVENKNAILVCIDKFYLYYINNIKIFPEFVLLCTSYDYDECYNIRKLVLQLINLDVGNYKVQVEMWDKYRNVKSVNQPVLNYVCINT